MAREKTITRTIVTGYVYDVMSRNGANLEKEGEIIVPESIRSIKHDAEAKINNKLASNKVLVFNHMETKVYKISEADFMKYAKEVTDVTDQPETEPEQSETEQEA